MTVHQDFAEPAGDMAFGAIIAKATLVPVIAAVTIDASRSQLARITCADMAGRADQAAVTPGEREAGRVVMIEIPRFPRGGNMALLAWRGCSQRAGVAFVLVACGTGQALRGKILAGMATGALERGMLAQQRETGEIVVETNASLPAFAGVAALAIPTQLAAVRIILGMARSALRNELDLVRRVNMAGFAPHLRVFSQQWKSRHRGMIEADRFPRLFGVAALAILSVPPFVRIILGMAGVAGDGGLGDLGRLLVAACAGCRAVGPFQGEAGHSIMIEADLLPRPWAMAIGAIGAVGALVRIITGMAGIAGAGRVQVGIARAVAAGAGGCGMAADQRVAGARMIEGHGFPCCCCMATRTVGAAGSLVGIVLFMTGHAGGSQPFPALAGMA